MPTANVNPVLPAEFILTTGVVGAIVLTITLIALVHLVRTRLLGPGGKLAWAIGILVIPILAPIAYLIVVPRSRSRRITSASSDQQSAD